MKRIFVFILAIVLVLGLTGIAVAEKDPIRIGVLSNNADAVGMMVHAAVDLFFEQHGSTICGRPVEIFHENTSSDAAIAVEKLIKCVDEYGCQIIIGPRSGSEGTAIREYAEIYNDEATIIIGSSGSTQITINTPENLWRICATAAQVGMALGEYAYNELGYRNVLAVASDYDFTFGQVQGFMYGFVGAGGNIVDKIWFTKGTTDYSSVVTSISKYDNVDAVFCGVGAIDSIYFVGQYAEYGLTLPLLGGSNFTDTTCLTSDIADKYEGIITSSYYADEIGTEVYNNFINTFKDYHGSYPNSFASDFYIGAEIATMALEKIDGNIEDVEAFRAALQATDYESHRGRFRFDDAHQYICDVFITKVTQTEDGTYKNIPLVTIENVSQFGKFDPEWFASQPYPDRNNPTIESIRNAKYAE